ncbi:DDE-type integrase/transposase/recombinase [Sinanaerobacter chloroacetimidivorans]|uniref:DDE-type integrase/transposase/recombinase n=1 Tax=Sinanaerobacter chloroacetimidivorans TaxID=2818044 RepID=A0A8J7W553_9FIRM|nr:DDE-type integrase/transposase/recombinase [Sinanaerobacter chloroacetimidivorans]MBR0600649.1 DDE-type integrase/transposase/recombinase [Sinanaerobacter chloroacetimidivorans]
MDNIILYLLQTIQQLYQQNCWLLNFICRYIPLKQWAFDDSHSPKYQKFTTDKLPIIRTFIRQDWQFLLEYYSWKYNKPLRPVQRRNGKSIPEDTICPLCGAPHLYIYDNNGGNGQYQCKVCGQTFITGEIVTSPIRFVCPYCGHALVAKKDRAFFHIHKCVNPKCSFYLHNLKKVDKEHLDEAYGKNKYKLHYIYREFTVDFFRMDLSSLPKNASSLKFTKHNSHIMSLCLTMHVNLQLSLRRTAQALDDLYGIKISHQMVANYARTAALVIKPFVDHYDYPKSSTFIADETYIKVRSVKAYVWLIMDAVSRSILGYQVSDNRSVGPCILAMRMAFRGLKKLPENFRFIADGYSAYPLAAQQFFREYGDAFKFDITQVIGLTNDDAVTTEFRPFKQMVERLNRTFKASYRVSCGYDNYDGANYNVSLWVAYYNFLRPHKHKNYHVLNKVEMLEGAENMPGKWQLLIYLGQQTILRLQEQQVSEGICS